MTRYALLFLLAGCSTFPQLDDRISPAAEAAPYPDLVALAPILAAADGAAGRSPPVLAGRLAALRARATALRGPVVDPATRARMRRGVQAPLR